MLDVGLLARIHDDRVDAEGRHAQRAVEPLPAPCVGRGGRNVGQVQHGSHRVLLGDGSPLPREPSRIPRPHAPARPPVPAARAAGRRPRARRQSITKAGTPVAPARCALAVETSTACAHGRSSSACAMPVSETPTPRASSSSSGALRDVGALGPVGIHDPVVVGAGAALPRGPARRARARAACWGRPRPVARRRGLRPRTARACGCRSPRRSERSRSARGMPPGGYSGWRSNGNHVTRAPNWCSSHTARGSAMRQNGQMKSDQIAISGPSPSRIHTSTLAPAG